MNRKLIFIILASLGLLLPSHTSTKASTPEDQQFNSSTNILASITGELKKPEYLQEILPNNFSYFMQLLQYGKKTQQTRAYVRSVFRLYSNLLKGASYVNAYAFYEMLEQLPTLLRDYFILYKSLQWVTKERICDAELFDRVKEATAQMCYTRFIDQYEYFKKDPEKFLDELSHQIAVLTEEEVSLEQLRQVIIRFLEIGLGKLVWSPEDKEKTWETVKKIAERLTTLFEFNVIDDANDLDDLFWALTHRYCFFLDITSTELSLEVYEKIRQDINNEHLLFLELEEQEPFLMTKTDYLKRALLLSESKYRAYQAGIITH